MISDDLPYLTDALLGIRFARDDGELRHATGVFFGVRSTLCRLGRISLEERNLLSDLYNSAYDLSFPSSGRVAYWQSMLIPF